MFCIVLLMMSWCIPPLVALVCGPGSHRMEMNANICQEQSTVCPNFFPLCLYIQKDLIYLSWLEGETAVGIKNRVIKMHGPIAVSTDRSTFGMFFG